MNLNSVNVNFPQISVLDMKKKKKFIVDKVTEDSFFENLLLGLPNFIEGTAFISNVQLLRFAPASIKEINSWQCTNGVVLPADLHCFYQSTNGFHLSYKFHFCNNDNKTGGIYINPLSKLVQIFDQTDYATSKMFSLVKVDEVSDVILAFSGSHLPPSFWLYRRPGAFRYLCADFVTYFRMSLAHVGIPGWHFAENMSSEHAELFHLVAPGVLCRDEMQNCSTSTNNVIDQTVFEDFNQSRLSLEEKSKAVDSVCKKKRRRKPTGSALSSARTYNSAKDYNSPRQLNNNKKNSR